MNLVTWLLGLVAPFAIRAVIALGFTAVTFTGVSVAANSLITIAQTNWSALPTNVLQLSEISGIPEVLGMIAGAYIGRVAVWSALNGVKYVLRP
jgi:hypothetical protein